MMTPQEVASTAFTKAVMGGYNMAAVDTFLDKLTEDYTALYKENSTLKAKMKVLADKVEEYRQVDESMRGALLAAQKMAKDMIAEAEGKRDSILKEAEQLRRNISVEAERGARQRAEELRQMILSLEQRQREVSLESDRLVAAEAERLKRARTATAEFIMTCRSLCQGHLALLDRLPDVAPELSSLVAPTASAPAASPVPPSPPPAVVPEPAPPEKAPEDVVPAMAEFTPPPVEPVAPETPDEPAWKDESFGDTRVIKLDQLQFGRNYKREDD